MNNDISGGSDGPQEPVPPKSRLLDDARIPVPGPLYDNVPASAGESFRPGSRTKGAGKSWLILLILFAVLFIGLIIYLMI
jgi:hypothetical protein